MFTVNVISFLFFSLIYVQIWKTFQAVNAVFTEFKRGYQNCDLVDEEFELENNTTDFVRSSVSPWINKTFLFNKDYKQMTINIFSIRKKIEKVIECLTSMMKILN